MLRIRHALLILGLLAVGSSLTGCAVYSRPGYVRGWHYDHRYERGRW